MGDSKSSSCEATDRVADEDCRWEIEGVDDVFEHVSKIEVAGWLLVCWTRGFTMPGPVDAMAW